MQYKTILILSLFTPHAKFYKFHQIILVEICPIIDEILQMDLLSILDSYLEHPFYAKNVDGFLC